jgi:predicted secreted Zn-dependent protease
MLRRHWVELSVTSTERSNAMKRAVILLAVCQACIGAFAQPNASQGPGASVNYICGGVAQDEQQSMKAQAPQHDLMLTFAISTGAYLADVDVQIKDRNGATVLSARCDGPMMLVDLPANGRFHVTAQVDGLTREKTVATHHGRLSRATLIWPAGTS